MGRIVYYFINHHINVNRRLAILSLGNPGLKMGEFYTLSYVYCVTMTLKFQMVTNPRIRH